MPRIDLAIPFAEKDEAKRLGTRWDGERKLWYVPDGVDAGAFGRWLPSEPDIGVRSSSYFIAQTTKPYGMNHCEHCGMKQGDFEMYCEPQGAFFPMDERAASLIGLHEFAEPFGCNGSTAYGDHLFEYMRRA